MAKAIRIHAFGDPSVLQYEDLPALSPRAGEALVKIDAIGVNYLDIYHRNGIYPITLPVTLGQEAAGTVAAVGDGVTTVQVGDRVAWTGVFGSYAEANVVPADRLVAVPPGVTMRQAASAMLQGITAHYLATSTYPLKAGDTCLVHAGAGGVGLLLTQVAKMRGARVITTASAANHAYLKTLGPDQIIDYNKDDFTKIVSNVDAVFDTVGGDVATRSYDVLKAGGRAAFIASGAKAPATARSDVKGLRPAVGRDRAHLDRIRTLIESGAVKVPEITVFPLADAAKANAVSKGRHFRGKLVLKVR